MVADGLRLPVSRHFYYSSFAVRGRHDSPQLRVYICEGTPGTGFFVRNTESRSYMRFVAERKKNLKQNPLTLLAGREPNFDKEMARVESALQRHEHGQVAHKRADSLQVEHCRIGTRCPVGTDRLFHNHERGAEC